MEKQWNNIANHGKTMKQPWKNNGTTLQAMENDGKTIDKPFKTREKQWKTLQTMDKQWKKHWQNQGKPRTANHEN